MKEEKMMENEIVLFETEDKSITLPVQVNADTVWLNRNQLAELFGRDIKTIGKHIGNALKEELEVYIKNGSTVLDACCGEGYFTNELSKAYPEADFYGFDLSKRAVRYAARDAENAIFFAANISSIPFADKSVDVLTHIFAPVCDAEFSRILKDDGIFVHVFPGKDHLMGIKELLYEKTRENDEDAGVSEIFELVSSKKIRKDICLDNAALVDLLTMTPYFYRTPKDRLEDVMKKDSASTPAEFIINIYKKRV